MDEVVIYIPKAKLKSTVGLMYRGVLKSLVEQGMLNSFTEAFELRFDKDKALHIQSVLEFYDVRDAASGPLKPIKREDDK